MRKTALDKVREAAELLQEIWDEVGLPTKLAEKLKAWETEPFDEAPLSSTSSEDPDPPTDSRWWDAYLAAAGIAAHQTLTTQEDQVRFCTVFANRSLGAAKDQAKNGLAKIEVPS